MCKFRTSIVIVNSCFKTLIIYLGFELLQTTKDDQLFFSMFMFPYGFPIVLEY